jgi:hypothetical protein
MAAHFAEIDAAGVVLRVILAPDQAWCVDNLGGTWVQTANPDEPDPSDPSGVAYCGPGYGHDDTFPDRFAPLWVQPVTTVLDGEPAPPYPTGSLAFHNGRIWRSVTDVNVWEPGVSGWRPFSLNSVAEWIQPTGAHDAYTTDDVVSHGGSLWISTNAANVWEPGVVAGLWIPYVEAPDNIYAEWATGIVFDVADVCLYESALYACVQAHTSANNRRPSNSPTFWQLVG